MSKNNKNHDRNESDDRQVESTHGTLADVVVHPARPLCVDEYEPNKPLSYLPMATCVSDDETGCPDDCPSGGPGDIGSDSSASLYGGGGGSGGSTAWSRVGSGYKNVGLGSGDAEVRGIPVGDPTALGMNAAMAWSNRMLIGGQVANVDRGYGRNWSLNLGGRLTKKSNGDVTVFMLPGSGGEKQSFKLLSNGDYEAICPTLPQLVELTDTWEMSSDGQTITFDHTSGLPLSSSAADGTVTEFKYENQRLVEVVSSRMIDGDQVFSSLVLTYAEQATGGGPGGPGGPVGPGGPLAPVGPIAPISGTPGMPVPMSGSLDSESEFRISSNPMLATIESILQRVYVGSSTAPTDADYEPQSRLEFEIPETTSAGRYTARSLYKIHKQLPDGSGGWNTESTKMFIYYTSGPIDMLKYVIDPAGYESLANPDTASDAQLKSASSSYYQYDADYRVSRVETYGGTQWSTITYTENTSTPTDPANNWKRKAVYTSNDGSVKTVYSNHLGKDMLLDETMGSDRWVHYFKFDANGRQIEAFSPSCIDFTAAPFDESQSDLAVQVKTSEGRVDLTSWYTTTGSGAAKGKLESRSVKKGSAGTPIKTFEREYTSKTEGGVTIYPVAKEIQFPQETGPGIETTYSYTWHSGTLAPKTVTTNLPNVPAAQNGSSFPQMDTLVAEFNSRGQLIKQTDARGTVTLFEYDSASNALVRQTQDPTGLNLVTDFEVSIRGRQTRSLGPAHDVDGVNVRTASWNIKDGPYETRTAAGFQTVSSGNFTLVNPVSIRKQSADGTTVDQITATRGTSVQSNGELSTSDSFPQTSWSAWTRSIHDIFGRLISTRVYHNIPMAGEGTVGTHYHETVYDGDAMGRNNRVETPDGTIRRSVFNAHDQVVNSWVGTNDTGATDSDPTGNGAFGNDMVMLSTNEYDNNQSGLDRQLTKTIVHNDASSDRVTTFEYDWRGRQTVTVLEGPTFNHISRQSLDNLDRPFVSESLSDDGTGEVLTSRSQSLFDDRGRTYRSIREGVDQDNGTLTGETIVVDMEYDAGNNVTKQTPAGGSDFMTYVYDALGRRTSQTNALSQTSSVSYNEAGQTISSTDALSNTSSSQYDEIGRMVKSINALSQTVSESQFDSAGRMLSQTNGVGDSTTFAYDDAGRRVSVTDPEGNVSLTSYDSMNRVIQAQDPLGNFVSFQYDMQGRQKMTIDQMLEITETVYDLAGNVVQKIDAKGNATLIAYDNLGRQTTVTDRLTGVTSFEYDRAGRRSKITDAEGGETVYGFDSFGRAASTQYPDHVAFSLPGNANLGIVTMDYDSKGRLSVRTDQKGNSVTHNYDAAGRMVSREYREFIPPTPGGVIILSQSPIVDSDTFTYDANGRMLTAISGRYGNTVTFVYDNAGRKTSESQAVASQTYTTSYAYDSASRVTSMTYPDGKVVDRSYNSRGLLDEVEFDSSSVDIRTYDNAGRIATSTYGNGVVTTHTHRADGLISSIATANSGTQKVGTYAYGWDQNKNKTSETISGVGFMSNFGFNASTYDDEDRITGWTRSDGLMQDWWTLNKVGVIKNYDRQTASGSGDIQQARTINEVHEITAINNTPVSHDANGNTLVSSAGDSLTWDLDNRLTNAGSNHSFEYDALGRRVAMTEGSSTTTLVCPNAQLIAMYDSGAAASSPERIFVYGSYIDEPLMMKAGSTKSYYSRNQQFSITALTDDSGQLVERYAYDAYGNTITMSPVGGMLANSSVDNPFAYTGRFLHNDLDLMYFRARYYDPNTGEFLSRDPLEYVDGMSQYRGYFVPNGMDPEGTSWLTYWMCVFQYSERADWLRHIFRGHGMPTHENSKGYNAFLHCNIACGLSTSCRKPWDDRETPGNNGGDMDIANNGCGFDVSDAQGGTNSGDCWKGCLEKWNSGKLTCIIKGVLAPCPPAPTDVDSEIFGHIDDEYDMPDIQTNGCF
jgi:RHS repeat-associated protein